MDGRPRRVPQAGLRQGHVLGGDGTRLGGGSRAAESPTQFRSAGGACWASPGERWPLQLELRLAPALPCCGPAYGQTLAAVTRIRHVQGSPPHAARRCPMRESDRRALVAPHPHHLHRPILDLLDPPPLAWLWASGRGRAVPSGGRGSFSCRAPAGRPTAPRVFQLGPRNSRRRCRSQCSCFSHFANEKNVAWNGVHISRSTVLLAGARAGCFLHQCWARSLRRGPTWAEPSSPGSCPCPLPLGTGVRWLGPRASSGLQPGP